MPIILLSVVKELGHSNFGYSVFSKERPSSGIDFINKYRVTKVGVSQFVYNKLYFQLYAFHHEFFCFFLWLMIKFSNVSPHSPRPDIISACWRLNTGKLDNLHLSTFLLINFLLLVSFVIVIIYFICSLSGVVDHTRKR